MIKILEHLMNDEGPPGAEWLIEDFMGLWRLVRAAAYPPHHARLTAEQFWLPRYLERQCPVSLGALAEALGITPSSATTACKRLEQAGLVMRTRQATDERVV
jgi:DNA-binding MarR family transcriptional regulator